MARTAFGAVLLLALLGGLHASAKRLVTFGDSITDNGNGTSKVVQAYYTKLLGTLVDAVRCPAQHSHPAAWPTWCTACS
jgi:hypothetical protein